MKRNWQITALSDTHTLHENFNVDHGGDLLIHSGDALSRGNHREFKSFAEWINEKSKKFKHTIYVPGNHDGYVAENFDEARKELDSNIIILRNEFIEIDGLKIWGSPYTPTFMDWWFMKPESDLGLDYEKMPEDLDILITHGPPWGILDIGGPDSTPGRLGSSSLRYHTDRAKPKMHFFGHIHESYGVKETPDTAFINCAVAPVFNRRDRKPIRVYWDNEAKVILQLNQD